MVPKLASCGQPSEWLQRWKLFNTPSIWKMEVKQLQRLIISMCLDTVLYQSCCLIE
ncbi:hypothetical protein Hanom_Chr15g01342391 [Helianthus anomalus]